MQKHKLCVYLRLKPLQNLDKQRYQYKIDRDFKNIRISIPQKNLYTNEIEKTHANFEFDGIFEEKASQELIYQVYAQPTLEKTLKGYNTTIFAYGQTGSGKTFTILGGGKWQDRGVIPRVIGQVFREKTNKTPLNRIDWDVKISMIEIYNENVYDLQNVENEGKSFSDWEKLDFFENESGETEIANLKKIDVTDENEAMQLLMKGNFLRHSASTTMNPLSSRSHSVFTIYLKGYSNTKKAYLRSKFNLVDLAGSERVNKSNTTGVLQDEAKNINKSLMFLEQVVIALDERRQGKRIHIPFRNSALTMVLKDSLDGNCIISMVANMSIENTCIDESVSTARFAMRCQKLETSLEKNLQFEHDQAEQNDKTIALMKEQEMYKLSYEESTREVKARDKLIVKLKEDLNKEKIKNQNLANNNVELKTNNPTILIDNQAKDTQKHDESVASLDDEKLTNFKDLAEKYLLEVIDDLPAKNVAECKIFFEIFRQLRNRTMFEQIKEVDTLATKIKEYESLEQKSRQNPPKKLPSKWPQIEKSKSKSNDKSIKSLSANSKLRSKNTQKKEESSYDQLLRSRSNKNQKTYNDDNNTSTSAYTRVTNNKRNYYTNSTVKSKSPGFATKVSRFRDENNYRNSQYDTIPEVVTKKYGRDKENNILRSELVKSSNHIDLENYDQNKSVMK